MYSIHDIHTSVVRRCACAEIKFGNRLMKHTWRVVDFGSAALVTGVTITTVTTITYYTTYYYYYRYHCCSRIYMLNETEGALSQC